MLMFHVLRRVLPLLPALSGVIGLMGQPALLALPPTMTALLILVHDWQIRRRVGLAAWPSDGFARHVLVDDLGRLICITLLGLPLFLLGDLLRQALAHP